MGAPLSACLFMGKNVLVICPVDEEEYSIHPRSRYLKVTSLPNNIIILQ